MRPPLINLASARRPRLSPALWIVLALAAGIFAIDSWWTSRRSDAQQARNMGAYAEAARVSADTDAQARAVSQRASQSIAERHMAKIDAAALLRVIESVQLPGVRVNSLLIETDEGLARLEIEVSNLDQLARSIAVLNSASTTFVWRITTVQSAVGGQPSSLAIEVRGREKR
jgi:hypothetical protein